MRGIFIGGLACGLAFGEGGHDEGLVPPAIIPRAGIGHFSVALLPLLRFLAAADERKRRAGHYGNVGASDDLQEAKRMRYFFVAPLVSANHRDPKHLDLRGLDHHEQGLQIAASGAGAVLVDDDLAARLG